jgi:hypothetical protein
MEHHGGRVSARSCMEGTVRSCVAGTYGLARIHLRSIQRVQHHHDSRHGHLKSHAQRMDEEDGRWANLPPELLHVIMDMLKWRPAVSRCFRLVSKQWLQVHDARLPRLTILAWAELPLGWSRRFPSARVVELGKSTTSVAADRWGSWAHRGARLIISTSSLQTGQRFLSRLLLAAPSPAQTRVWLPRGERSRGCPCPRCMIQVRGSQARTGTTDARGRTAFKSETCNSSRDSRRSRHWKVSWPELACPPHACVVVHGSYALVWVS